jgi:hypothetical protein
MSHNPVSCLFQGRVLLSTSTDEARRSVLALLG